MIQIPQHILDGLRCYLCSGYLSVKPILVRQGNQQVCGKCYKSLSVDEREKCVRQIGLENVAVMLTFPCRYNVSGCGFTFRFNDQNQHEEECQYRYRTIKSANNPTLSKKYGALNDPSKSLFEIKFESDEIFAIISYEIDYNKYYKDLRNLNYNLEIRGNCDNTLAVIDNANSRESKNVRLLLEGTVLLGEQPESIYSNIKLISSEAEHIYDTLKMDYLETLCDNCKEKITDTIHYCQLAHPSCANCKDKMCYKCSNIKPSEVNGFCKNYARGCVNLIDHEDYNAHMVNCEFNDFKCPFEGCTFCDTLPLLKVHLISAHENCVYIDNAITKTFSNKDEIIVFLLQDEIFKCRYYNYKTFMEFFVKHEGVVDHEKNYKYEITVETTDGPVTRRAPCSNWNNESLEKGIEFEKAKLISKTKRLIFDIKLKIILVK